MSDTDVSYEQALNSFNGLRGDLGTGGRKLLRSVLKIGQAEGISRAQIANDVAERLQVSRGEVLDALSKCQRSRPRYLQAVPEPAKVKFFKGLAKGSL